MGIDKIKSNIKILDNGCWEWQNSCNSAGYGQLTVDNIYWLSHRYAYACIDMLSPEDVVRHKCHNTKCCNPEHLIKGTHKDNWNDSKELHLASSAARRKTWCVNGIVYNTLREAALDTGIHQGTLIKYTVNGIFNIENYRTGCKKGNVKPKV